MNNYGFNIERRMENIDWEKIGFAQGNGNSNSVKEYSFEDKNLNKGKYSYRLKQIDNDGKYEYSKEVEVTVDYQPEKFELYQNYPNPFNPATKIKYAIPAGGASFMKFTQLKVYDILGNEVATLVNEEKPAGSYEVTFNAVNLQSGIYFYRLQAGNFIVTKMMVLLK